MTQTIIILGATSDIAKAICHQYANEGKHLVLGGRNDEELKRLADDLRIRYKNKVETEIFDAQDIKEHASFVQKCLIHCDKNEIGVILCHGILPDQKKAESDPLNACLSIDVNFTSAVSLLGLFANNLEERKQGFIAAISSVAGDRGRQSNYIYGAAKAGLTTFLQGLRNRMNKANVHVLTIKPGFVMTSMTEGMLDPKSILVAQPERVAFDILKAIKKQRNTIYTPWFWWGIMKIICLIPESIFKRMKL